MKTLIKISWRNIWRNRTRSLIIIVAIILGLMGGIFSAAVRLGTEQQQYRESVEHQISHIQIHHPEFIANPEARFRIEDGFEIAEAINKMEGISIASARTVFDGMVASASMNSGVRIKGIDPEAEALTTSLDRLITEGSYFEAEGRMPSVIIGEALADKLNAGVGSRIVLTFQDVDGEILSTSFRVEALFKVSSTRFEERNVFVKNTEINSIIGDDHAVNEIAILLDNGDDYRKITNALREAYPTLEVRNWADIMPALLYALEFLDQSLVWLVGIIIMGVSFGLLNTILMSVLERIREFGVLMAIGMKKTRVFGMILMETTMVSLIGGIVGLIFSFGMVEYLNKRGLDLSSVGGDGMAEFGYASVIYPNIDPGFYFQILAVVVAFAILASIYPAWKSIRLVPAEAVRAE
ncbi:MAG: FtsX-like permease family protein [Bacteroidales bacterium]|nr:FtsX-like permease family protein [Bacteroidales bacterium]